MGIGRPRKADEDKAASPYTLAFTPIVLKEIILDCAISQSAIAGATGVSRPTINLALNRGYIPKERPHFKEDLEKFLRENGRAMNWLIQSQLKMEDIWTPLGKPLRKAMPANFAQRVSSAMRRMAMVPGNPEIMTIDWEVEMISQEAKQHFRLLKDPFRDDVQSEKDIFMSDEHRYIEAAMLDAARHGGFLAISGEVGSGKSIIRIKVVEQLKKDGDVLIVFPRMIDRTRVTAASICDAIIMDLSDQKPKIKQEHKTRQVRDLLLERSKQGYQTVLIIEEAHDLAIPTLKYIKRIHELENGFRKLLSVILVGQSELRDLLDERKHIEMREVIRRIQIAEIRGLNGNIKPYLALKFRRVGSRIEDIFTDEAITALAKRLTLKDDRNRTISHAYPLTVNNYAARSMNEAHEMGEKKVTEDVINRI